MLKPEPESDPPDQLFLLAPAVVQKKDIQVQACTSCKLTINILIHFSYKQIAACSFSVYNVMQMIKQNLSLCHGFKKLTLATMCHLQVDREPVTMTAVKSVVETHNPELLSLSILG